MCMRHTLICMANCKYIWNSLVFYWFIMYHPFGLTNIANSYCQSINFTYILFPTTSKNIQAATAFRNCSDCIFICSNLKHEDHDKYHRTSENITESYKILLDLLESCKILESLANIFRIFQNFQNLSEFFRVFQNFLEDAVRKIKQVKMYF